MKKNGCVPQFSMVVKSFDSRPNCLGRLRAPISPVTLYLGKFTFSMTKLICKLGIITIIGGCYKSMKSFKQCLGQGNC